MSNESAFSIKGLHIIKDSLSRGHPDTSMGFVTISSVNLGFFKEGIEHSIPLIKRVKKVPFEVSDGLETQAMSQLMKTEIETIRRLNEIGNPNVPVMTESSNNSYSMRYIYGESAASLRDDISLDTKLFIVLNALDAMRSVFDRRVVNLDYNSGNLIVQINV